MNKLFKKLLLGCALLSATTGAIAQSPFWAFNYSNTLNFPSLSTTPLYPLVISGGHDELSTNSHSIYNNAGQLLFTVTESGVYDKGGAYIYGLVTDAYQKIRSEIEVFPNAKECGHYYIVYYRDNDHTGHGSGVILLDVDASDYAYAPVVRFVENLTGDLIHGSVFSSISQYGYVHHVRGSDVGLVVTSADNAGSRKLYIPTLYIDPTYTYQEFGMLSWQFNQDGTHPQLATVPLSYGGSLSPVDEELSGPGDKMNRNTIMEATPDGSKIAYGGAFSLKVFNTASSTITTYPINDLTNAASSGAGTITGIEWLPQYNRWYVSYVYAPIGGSHEQGAIGYFDDGITSVFHPVTIPPGINAGASEIERGIDNKLYFADCPYCNLSGGTPLGSYLPYNITSAAGATPYTTPGNLYALDPISGSITSVPGIQVKSSTFDGKYYYLNNQIDGEDYSRWDASTVSKIKGIALETGITGSGSGPGSSVIIGNTFLISDPIACTSRQADACNNLTLQFTSAAFVFPPSAPIPYVGLASYEEYKISWTLTDSCGGASYSSPLNYTDPTWHNDAAPIDLKTYGSAALSSPGAWGKTFRLEVSVHNKCTDATITYFLVFKVAIPPAPALSDLKVNNSSGFSSFVSMGTTCTTPICSYTDAPMIQLNGWSNLKNYKLIVKDYGSINLPCPRATVASYLGSTFDDISGAFLGIVTLSSYLNTRCGMPSGTALTYFTTKDRVFGVQVIAESPCGVIDTLDERFFSNCDDTHSVSKQAGQPFVSGSNVPSLHISPNPANDYLNISISNADQQLCSADLLDMTGKKVLTLVPTQSIAGNKIQYSINTATLPAGMYLYRYTLDGKTQTEKLVITH